MDKAVAICLAFPPEAPMPDDAAYDTEIKFQLSKLHSFINQPPVPLAQYGGQILQVGRLPSSSQPAGEPAANSQESSSIRP